MNKKRMIGTYYLHPIAQTEQHIKDMKDCNIDFVIGIENNKNILDLLQKYDLKAIINNAVPYWFGANGQKKGQLQTQRPLELYINASKQYQHHPSIYGINVGDEPSGLDFEHYGKIIHYVNSHFSGAISYLNLYPNYGQLASNGIQQAIYERGFTDYKDYIEAYCQHIPLPYICFDHYPFSSTLNDFFYTFQTVRNVCNQYQKDLWCVLQVNSHDINQKVSLQQLRFQAFNALCYGASHIIWACYMKGWWHHQVLDEYGHKTEQYDKLKVVNNEIKQIFNEIKNYQYLQTIQTTSYDIIKSNGLVTIGVYTYNQSTLYLITASNLQNESILIEIENNGSYEIYDLNKARLSSQITLDENHFILIKEN